MNLYEVLKKSEADYDTYDTEFDACVTACFIDEEDAEDSYDKFCISIMKKVEVKENPFSGKTLCVTGKLNTFTRDSINAKISELGAKAASSVSKNTDYLITNEASGSSKYKKAVELNIPIITENEFLEMIGE